MLKKLKRLKNYLFPPIVQVTQEIYSGDAKDLPDRYERKVILEDGKLYNIIIERVEE